MTLFYGVPGPADGSRIGNARGTVHSVPIASLAVSASPHQPDAQHCQLCVSHHTRGRNRVFCNGRLPASHGDKIHIEYTANYPVVTLLLIDDWGLEPLEAAHRHGLMEIMDDRHGTTSTIVISQLPTQSGMPALVITPSQTPSWIVSCTIQHRLELVGESMRKLRADLTHRERT